MMRKPKTMSQGAKQLDANTFWQIEYPGPEEKLALQLAAQYQAEEDPDYVVVSWANQERAIKEINSLGFIKALDLLKQ